MRMQKSRDFLLLPRQEEQNRPYDNKSRDRLL